MYVSRELTCAGTVGFASDAPEFLWRVSSGWLLLKLGLETLHVELTLTHSLEPSPRNSLPEADKAAMEAQPSSSDT